MESAFIHRVGEIKALLEVFEEQDVSVVDFGERNVLPLTLTGQRLQVLTSPKTSLADLDALSFKLGVYVLPERVSESEFNLLTSSLNAFEESREELREEGPGEENDTQLKSPQESEPSSGLISVEAEEFGVTPIDPQEAATLTPRASLVDVEVPTEPDGEVLPVSALESQANENNVLSDSVSDVDILEHASESLATATSLVDVDRAWQLLSQLRGVSLRCYWVRAYDVTGAARLMFGDPRSLHLDVAERTQAVRALTSAVTMASADGNFLEPDPSHQESPEPVGDIYLPILLGGRPKFLWVVSGLNRGIYGDVLEALRYRTEVCIKNLITRKLLAQQDAQAARRDTTEQMDVVMATEAQADAFAPGETIVDAFELQSIPDWQASGELDAYLNRLRAYPKQPHAFHRSVADLKADPQPEFISEEEFAAFIDAFVNSECVAPGRLTWDGPRLIEPQEQWSRRSSFGPVIGRLSYNRRLPVLIEGLRAEDSHVRTHALMGLHVWKYELALGYVFPSLFEADALNRTLARSLLLRYRVSADHDIAVRLDQVARYDVSASKRDLAWLALACIAHPNVAHHLRLLERSDGDVAKTMRVHLQGLLNAAQDQRFE